MSAKRRPMRYAHCEGHTDVCYSGDGKYIVTCGGDGDVRLWFGLEDDDPTSQCVGERALAVCHSGKHLFVGTDNNYVQTYTFPELERDGIVSRFTASVTHIATNSEGKSIASGSCDMNIQIVNRESSESVLLTGHVAPVLGVALDPMGKYLASSSCDGTTRVWSLEQKKTVKMWNCLPLSNSFQNAKCLGRPCWQPKVGRYLAVPENKHVHLYVRDTWDNPSSFYEERVRKEFSIAAFSPCGRLLAACSIGGDICIWNVIQLTCISYTEHVQGYNICSLAWNPSGNGEIAYCDVYGQLGTVENCLEPSENNVVSSTETKGDLKANSAVSDIFDMKFPDDDDDDDENVISLNKIKDSVTQPDALLDLDLEDLSTKDDDVESKASEIVQSAVRIQPPFQPTSTPVHLQHRFMVWNSIGIVRAFNTEEENSLDVEFHDSALHHALHMNNYLKHTMASLSEQALVLACEIDKDTPSKVVCVLLNSWDGTREWSMDLPEEEEVLAVTASNDWLAVATDVRNLRLFTVGGTQREVLSLPGPVVSLASHMGKLLTVFHAGSGLSFMLLNVKSNSIEATVPCQAMPVSPQATLIWIGFSDEGTPSAMDSTGMLRILSSKGYWLPVCNTKAQCKGQSDHYFILGVSERYQNIRCVLCKGSRFPATTPRPAVAEIPIQLPLCDASNEKTMLEEKFWRSQIIFSSLDDMSRTESSYINDKEEVDKLMKETIIKLFALACRSGLEHRAVDLCGLMPSHQVVQLAVKYASKLGKMHLADRLSEVVAQKKREHELRLENNHHTLAARMTWDHASTSSGMEPCGTTISRTSSRSEDADMFADSQDGDSTPIVREKENLLLAAKQRASVLTEVRPFQKRLNPFKKSASSNELSRGLDSLNTSFTQANEKKGKETNGTASSQEIKGASGTPMTKTKQMGLWGKSPAPKQTFVQWFAQEKTALQAEFPNKSASELTRMGMKRFKEQAAKDKQSAEDVSTENSTPVNISKQEHETKDEDDSKNTDAENVNTTSLESRKRKLAGHNDEQAILKKTTSAAQKLSCFVFKQN